MAAKKTARLRGSLAITLGVVGSLLALATAVAAILFVVGANNIVDDVGNRITQPIDRVDALVEQTSAGLPDFTSGELNARLENIADQAGSAETALDTITEHPLYSRVPVDVSSLEDRLRSAAERAEELGEIANDDVSDADRSLVDGLLDDVAAPLDDVEAVVENTTDSLRFWIRLSGLAFLALSLWTLWAQISLARHGRRAWSNRTEGN